MRKQMISMITLVQAIIPAVQATAAEHELKVRLSKSHSSPLADGALTARCQLSDQVGDVYKTATIYAHNNVNFLLNCNFTCTINRKGGLPYPMKCHLDIPGGKDASCGATVSYHDYQSIDPHNSEYACNR